MSYDCIHYSHINDLLCIFIYANAKTWAERFANQACRSGFAMETAILEFSTKWIAHVLQKQSSVTQWGWLRSYFELIKWNTVQYALHFARVVVIKYTIWHQTQKLDDCFTMQVNQFYDIDYHSKQLWMGSVKLQLLQISCATCWMTVVDCAYMVQSCTRSSCSTGTDHISTWLNHFHYHARAMSLTHSIVVSVATGDYIGLFCLWKCV